VRPSFRRGSYKHHSDNHQHRSNRAKKHNQTADRGRCLTEASSQQHFFGTRRLDLKLKDLFGSRNGCKASVSTVPVQVDPMKDNKYTFELIQPKQEESQSKTKKKNLNHNKVASSLVDLRSTRVHHKFTTKTIHAFCLPPRHERRPTSK
jgi:hypothetical protein